MTRTPESWCLFPQRLAEQASALAGAQSALEAERAAAAAAAAAGSQIASASSEAELERAVEARVAGRAQEARAAVAEAQARVDAARYDPSRCGWQCPDAVPGHCSVFRSGRREHGPALLMQCLCMSSTARFSARMLLKFSTELAGAVLPMMQWVAWSTCPFGTCCSRSAPCRPASSVLID